MPPAKERTDGAGLVASDAAPGAVAGLHDGLNGAGAETREGIALGVAPEVGGVKFVHHGGKSFFG
jgi:hypothetical protein